MNRRDFLKAATGAAGGAAVSGVASPVAAQETTESPSNETTSGNGTETAGGATTQAGGGSGGGGGGGGGGTKTVKVGPGGDYVFTPGTSDPLYASPGTTVKFVWESNGHNIVVDGQPDGAGWEGHEPLEDSGFSYEHTFDATGEYSYFCQPHKALGMTGTITINDSGAPPAASGGAVEVDPEDMGVPIQAHYVGIATILMLVVSFIYTFFFLKYGESAHSSSPNR